jgi:uncharacterized repeat protein (TIGR01451 family)
MAQSHSRDNLSDRYLKETTMTNDAPSMHRSLYTMLRPALLLALLMTVLGFMTIPLFTSSANSRSVSETKKEIQIGRTREMLVSSGTGQLPAIFNFLSPVFQSPTGITTYAGDCTTPKSLYNVQDTDLTVCAKVTGAQPTQEILWSNAKFELKQRTTVGTDSSFTFTLTAASNLGDWRVILYEPFGGSVYAVTPFTVIDAANPESDLTISKTTFTDPVSAGSQASFGIQITNLGPDAATNVQVTDSTPANTTFSSFALISGQSGVECGVVENNVTCTIPTLARGETAVFSAAYDINTGTPGGILISNTATVSSAVSDPRSENNSSTATVGVTSVTAEECILDCPANVVVTANTTQGGQPGAFVTYGAASVTGNCGAVTNTPASGSFFTVGTHSILSQSATGETCTFSVTVLDTAPPTITCPATATRTTDSPSATDYTFTPPDSPGNPSFTASGSGDLTAVRSDDTPAVYDDNGNVVTPPVVHTLTDPWPIGSTGILWTVKDAGGRTKSCSQTVTILLAEARPPVTISCPGNVSVGAPSGSCEATVDGATIGTPTTNPSDSHVDVVGVRSDGKTFSEPFPAGTTQITWTATDDLTNTSAFCIQNVTVTVSNSGDTTPPTLIVPPNVTRTTSSCTVTIDNDELGTAQASDTGTCNGSVTVIRTGVPANFVFPTGTTTILYTATDASGNTSQGVQLVTVTESPAVPLTITAPADVSANTGAGATSCGTVVSDAALGSAIANDNCAGVVVTRTGVPAGNIFPEGMTTVTYTATDASGNTATDTQIVTVTDNTLPVVTPPAAVTLYTGAGATSCGLTVSNLDATLGTGSATDNCPGVGAVTRTGVPSGNVFPLGDTTVTYSATDAHGNTGSATQVVTVVDNTPPTISCPASITLEPTCPTGAVATWTPPVGTDNCPGAVTTRTAGGAPGSVFAIGTTTVTYSVTDAHGNGPVSCSFTVTVLTPQAVIQNLQAAVGASSLTGTQKNGLLAKLSSALSAINGGQTNVACNKLSEFVNNVGNLISQGALTAAQGNAWISSANHVRNTIGCTNLGCS